MKNSLAIILTFIGLSLTVSASDLPETVLVTGQEQHVQGIAYDSAENCR